MFLHYILFPETHPPERLPIFKVLALRSNFRRVPLHCVIRQSSPLYYETMLQGICFACYEMLSRQTSGMLRKGFCPAQSGGVLRLRFAKKQFETIRVPIGVQGWGRVWRVI